MNSKIPSTSSDSLNSMIAKTCNENLYRQQKDTSHELISLENVDINLVNYLNNELINLGYQSIQQSNSLNSNLLLENSIDIISRFNRQSASLNRSQDQNYKLDHENELLVRRQQSLKDANEASSRELANLEEKYRQAQLKTSTLNKTIKDLTEENRKLHNSVEQRDKQYKHERKKLEKENNRLKERVQVLTTGKTKELPNIDLSNSLYRGTNGTRATWNSDGSKKQLELYSELIKDYDRKNKELIIENTEIKTFLSEVYINLAKSLKNDDHSQNVLDRTDLNINSSKLQFENSSNELSADCVLSEEITKIPFDNIYSKLNNEFKMKFESVREKSQGYSRCLQQDSLDNLNNNIDNITISSINSFSTKNLDTENEDIMNTTFTIDDVSKSQNCKKSNNYFLDKTISSSTSSSSASPPSMSMLTEHLEKIHNSSSKSHNCKKLKSPLRDDGLSKIVNHSNEDHLFSDESTIKNELQILKNEREKLAMEKKFFYEQKSKLDEDTVHFRKISSDLIKKKNEFQEEQEKYYETKLFSSFSEQSTIK